MSEDEEAIRILRERVGGKPGLYKWLTIDTVVPGQGFAYEEPQTKRWGMFDLKQSEHGSKAPICAYLHEFSAVNGSHDLHIIDALTTYRTSLKANKTRGVSLDFIMHKIKRTFN